MVVPGPKIGLRWRIPRSALGRQNNAMHGQVWSKPSPTSVMCILGSGLSPFAKPNAATSNRKALPWAPEVDERLS
eukprot:12378860-Alexandrium_andersonii.AAC.1